MLGEFGEEVFGLQRRETLLNRLEELQKYNGIGKGEPSLEVESELPWWAGERGDFREGLFWFEGFCGLS